MTETKSPHPPGDPQAVANGCTCPVMDNGHGKGCGYVDADGWPMYVFDLECPLHGGDKAEEVPPETLCFEAPELQAAKFTQADIDAAISAEREACAKKAERMANGKAIAAAIRRRAGAMQMHNPQ